MGTNVAFRAHFIVIERKKTLNCAFGFIYFSTIEAVA